MSPRFEALPQGTSLATYQAAVTVELGFACEQYHVCPLKRVLSASEWLGG